MMTGSMHQGMGMMDSAQAWAAMWVAMGISALLWLALLVLAVLAIVWLVKEIGGRSGPAPRGEDAPAPRGH
jgi:hypothetical protein